MSEQLTFNRVYQYDTRLAGISIPVRLQRGSVTVEVEARLDTGSSHCVFKRADAELLGIDVDSGLQQLMRTVAGNFLTYAHEVTLIVLDIETSTTAYFAADENFSRNVLGRQGWLDRVRLGLVDYDARMYLSAYDDPAQLCQTVNPHIRKATSRWGIQTSVTILVVECKVRSAAPLSES